MDLELKIRNIVLIGPFNPSGFDRYFFIKNQVTSEDEILQNSMFLQGMTQLFTPDFNLIINNIQLIINANKPQIDDNKIADVLIALFSIDKTLKFSSSGINFNWFIGKSKDVSVLPPLSKKLCFNNTNRIQTEFFNVDDATFGFYSSKNILGTRLKLDVKPVFFKQNINEPEEAAVQFEFNFHKDYKEIDKSTAQLTDLLKNYKQFKKETENILSNL